MRQSQLFTKTRRESPKDEISKNAQLLIKAGFINKEIAGVYDYLPLGLRVLNKISQIIREEMNAIGGQEVFLTTLQDKEIWEKTDRWNDEKVGVWFKTKLKNGQELGLALTHEDPLTNLLSQYVDSYKDLPFYVYQIQNKFRNEVRSKSGILRGREFLMKDLYSFNKDQEGLDQFHEKAKEAYMKVFSRVGIGDSIFITFASGGIFSKYSHEFQALSDAGEDTIYLDRKKNLAVNNEVYTDEVIADLGLDKNDLEEVKAIEVGNIFKLGTRFSEPLGLTYVDENGDKKPVIMGSYGIGCGRLMGTIVEICSDANGIIWPEAVAPFKVHLIGLNLEDESVAKRAGEVYEKLQESGTEVLFDDRVEVSAGAKFSDADLIGCPYRVVVSKKTGDKVELKRRSENDSSIVELDDILKI